MEVKDGSIFFSQIEFDVVAFKAL